MTGGREYLITKMKAPIEGIKEGDIVLYSRTRGSLLKNFHAQLSGKVDEVVEISYQILHNGKTKRIPASTWDTLVETTCMGIPYGMKLREEMPSLYVEALKDMPQEFLDRALIKYSKWKRPEWTANARRYFDCLLEGNSDPTKANMRKHTLPLLYVKKYGELRCKMAMWKTRLTRWTNTCENLIKFSEVVNVPLDRIDIEVHGSAWHTTEKAYKKYEHVTALGGCLGSKGQRANVKYACVRRRV